MTRDAVSYSDQLNMVIYSESSQYFSSSKYQDEWIFETPTSKVCHVSQALDIYTMFQACSYQYFQYCLFFSTTTGRLSLQLRQKAGSPETQGKHSTLSWILNGLTTDTFKSFRKKAVSCSKNATWLLKACVAVCKRLSALKQHKSIAMCNDSEEEFM